MGNPSYGSLANGWLFPEDPVLRHVLARHTQRVALMFVESLP